MHMARSAPSSIAFIDSRVLHDLQAVAEEQSRKIGPSSVEQSDSDIGAAWAPSSVAPPNRLNRAVSWGGSWGVVTVGRGFDWKETRSSPSSDTASKTSDPDPEPRTPITDDAEDEHWGLPPHVRRKLALAVSNALALEDTGTVTPVVQQPPMLNIGTQLASSPSTEAFPSMSPTNPSPSPSVSSSRTPTRPPISRSCTSYSARRRSSAKRVSLVAGRVSVVSIEPPSPPPEPRHLPPKLPRFGSVSSLISVQSAAAPSECSSSDSFLGGRSIDDFEEEAEIGRGAYGLVKRAREIMKDGTLSPTQVIIKQVIKSRILADCWKKHPQHGTIPIEIFVMSAISSSTYSLPPPRPWDPARFGGETTWIEGAIVHGHPNICPLIDFFEDRHYYYLILPYSSPEPQPSAPLDEAPAKDLFDLVEAYPQGLPADLVRSYLGQLADAMCYLHTKGIVHRDIKDENVVLGPEPGRCILIDFGSSGVVRKHGWDTFSGTLDYAAPEILRGERYSGKEQDVWAYGIVAYVLLAGECPFITPAEAQEGLVSPDSKASIALDERCGGIHILEGEEKDGGGALGDAAALVRECLQVEVNARPTFERILESRFLSGTGGWGMLSTGTNEESL